MAPDLTGPVTVAVSALDAAGFVIASGTATQDEINVGGETIVVVTLVGGTMPDAGADAMPGTGGTDGSGGSGSGGTGGTGTGGRGGTGGGGVGGTGGATGTGGAAGKGGATGTGGTGGATGAGGTAAAPAAAAARSAAAAPPAWARRPTPGVARELRAPHRRRIDGRRLRRLALAAAPPDHRQGRDRGAHALTDEESVGLDAAPGQFRVAVTPYYFSLIDRDNPACPVRMQVIPRARELVNEPGDLVDPLGEDSHSPATGIFHRYPDRCLLLALDRCAIYCRHCNRRRLVGREESPISRADLDRRSTTSAARRPSATCSSRAVIR